MDAHPLLFRFVYEKLNLVFLHNLVDCRGWFISWDSIFFLVQLRSCMLLRVFTLMKL